jgi:hypothetical protein
MPEGNTPSPNSNCYQRKVRQADFRGPGGAFHHKKKDDA